MISIIKNIRSKTIVGQRLSPSRESILIEFKDVIKRFGNRAKRNRVNMNA